MAYFPPKHWDAGADKWDDIIAEKNFPHYFYYYEADLYIEELLKSSKIALELGVGTCGSTLKHASQKCGIVAIDYSRRMLEFGRKKLRDAGLSDFVDLVVADECNLPFTGASFDAVFSRGVAISYAKEPRRFALESFRVLRDGCSVGMDFMNRIAAGKPGRSFCRFERIGGILYYVEQFNEDGKQKRIGYKLPADFKPPQQLEGSVFGGFASKPDWLNLESLQTEEWWAVFYTPSEAQTLFEVAGFHDVKLFPLGCFTYSLADKKLHDFLRDNRDTICRLQKELAKVFKVEAGVHIFLTASKFLRLQLPSKGYSR